MLLGKLSCFCCFLFFRSLNIFLSFCFTNLFPRLTFSIIGFHFSLSFSYNHSFFPSFLYPPFPSLFLSTLSPFIPFLPPSSFPSFMQSFPHIFLHFPIAFLLSFLHFFLPPSFPFPSLRQLI